MSRRGRIWLIVGWLFVLANIGGAVAALAGGEMSHAALHVALASIASFFVFRAASRPREQLPANDETSARLARLQQSLDAIAIEVERIGEAQRFAAKVASERLRGPESG